MVSGLTPQIVTETIYALAVRQSPPFLPTQLVVMTTGDGANRAKLMLAGRDPGWIQRLCHDYHLPPIEFGPDNIRVLAGSDGQQLADIRTDADNTAAANAVTEAIHELTSDPEAALHVSLAGGRKTLGFFAGYALTLFGRVQDRLSHVLVSPELESRHDFFYPAPDDRIFSGSNNGALNPKEAQVTLTDIPFVRMREGLLPALRTGHISYAKAVAAAQGSLSPPQLVIDLRRRCVTAGESAFSLEPALLALYTWFARKAAAGNPWIPKSEYDSPEVNHQHAQEYSSEYRLVVGHAPRPRTFKDGMDRQYFSEQRAKLNAVLMAKIVGPLSEPYTVTNGGDRGNARYGIDLPPASIMIKE